MQAAIYIRVSTDDQAKTGYSLEAQLNACQQKLQSLGIDQYQVFKDDGFSGEFLERPGMDKLRHSLQLKEITVIVAYDPDRLSRNLAHMLLIHQEIEKAKAKICFVTGDYENTAEGRLFLSMRGAIAAFEKEKIRSRTMSGKRQKAELGKIIANRPQFGYNWNPNISNYEINTKEAAIVKEIYESCLNGFSLNQIVDFLASQNIKNKHGRKFNFKMVYQILTREIYTGIYYEGKSSWVKTGQNDYEISNKPKEQWLPIPVPAIISLEIQEKVKLQLSQNLINSKRNSKHEYLLSGLLKCPLCGYSISASWYSNIKAYYICNGNKIHKKCNARYIPLFELEQKIWSEICYCIENEIDLTALRENQFDHSEEINRLIQQETDIKEKQIALTDMMLDNLIPPDVAKKRLQKLSKELNNITTMLRELTATQALKKQYYQKFHKEDLDRLTTVSERNSYFKNAGLKIYVKREYGTDNILIQYAFE